MAAGAREAQGPPGHAGWSWSHCCGAGSSHGSQSVALSSWVVSRSVEATLAGAVAICTNADTVDAGAFAVGEARSFSAAGLVAVVVDALGDANASLLASAG